MCFQVLIPNNENEIDNPLWGLFHSEPFYNMDQVPLPFVVNHHRNFTTHDDNDVYISAPSDNLQKRQFTMHVVVNAEQVER